MKVMAIIGTLMLAATTQTTDAQEAIAVPPPPFPQKCTITTVQTKTNATPSPQLQTMLSALHPAGYNVTQPNHNFGDSFRVCACEICSAKLEIRVGQTTPRDLSGNDAYNIGIAPFSGPNGVTIANGTIWPSNNSAAPDQTITVNLNPQQLSRLLCDNKNNPQHYLDVYVQDDTVVKWTRLTTTHP